MLFALFGFFFFIGFGSKSASDIAQWTGPPIIASAKALAGFCIFTSFIYLVDLFFALMKLRSPDSGSYISVWIFVPKKITIYIYRMVLYIWWIVILKYFDLKYRKSILTWTCYNFHSKTQKVYLKPVETCLCWCTERLPWLKADQYGVECWNHAVYCQCICRRHGCCFLCRCCLHRGLRCPESLWDTSRWVHLT